MAAAGERQRPTQRLRVGLVDRQVVGEDPDRQELVQPGPDELWLDDGPEAGRHDPEHGAGLAQARQGGRNAREGDHPFPVVGERRLPEAVRVVEPVGWDAEPPVHLAPVGDVVPAVGDDIERQAEGGHHGRVRGMEGAERIDERSVPVEEDRLHAGDPSGWPARTRAPRSVLP